MLHGDPAVPRNVPDPLAGDLETFLKLNFRLSMLRSDFQAYTSLVSRWEAAFSKCSVPRRLQRHVSWPSFSFTTGGRRQHRQAAVRSWGLVALCVQFDRLCCSPSSGVPLPTLRGVSTEHVSGPCLEMKEGH